MKMVRGVHSACVILISTEDICFSFNGGVNCIFQYGNFAHLLVFRLFNFCINLELFTAGSGKICLTVVLVRLEIGSKGDFPNPCWYN